LVGDSDRVTRQYWPVVSIARGEAGPQRQPGRKHRDSYYGGDEGEDHSALAPDGAIPGMRRGDETVRVDAGGADGSEIVKCFAQWGSHAPVLP
jgi:hypothetical protein